MKIMPRRPQQSEEKFFDKYEVQVERSYDEAYFRRHAVDTPLNLVKPRSILKARRRSLIDSSEDADMPKSEGVRFDINSMSSGGDEDTYTTLDTRDPSENFSLARELKDVFADASYFFQSIGEMAQQAAACGMLYPPPMSEIICNQECCGGGGISEDDDDDDTLDAVDPLPQVVSDESSIGPHPFFPTIQIPSPTPTFDEGAIAIPEPPRIKKVVSRSKVIVKKLSEEQPFDETDSMRNIAYEF